MPQKLKFPHALCMPTQGSGCMVYPFGRWAQGHLVQDMAAFTHKTEQVIEHRLKRACWCLFTLLLTATIVTSARVLGGPYLSLEMRPLASTTIVSLPAMVYFVGRRLFVWRQVANLPRAPSVGRLFVWANIDNAFGAAVRHPEGALVVAPWLDAGRKYRLDVLSEQAALRIVQLSIAFELASVLCVCAILVHFYHQPLTCIYGVSLYYTISQPVLAGVELHVLLPWLAERWHPRTFDLEAIISKRYRWLRVFVISGVYMAALLLTRGPQSLPVKRHEPMETYLYLAAYATASCYATLAFVCLTKTWARPWSMQQPIKGVFTRGVFLLAVLFLTASIFEPIKMNVFHLPQP